jgi:hypothetical protein
MDYKQKATLCALVALVGFSLTAVGGAQRNLVLAIVGSMVTVGAVFAMPKDG